MAKSPTARIAIDTGLEDRIAAITETVANADHEVSVPQRYTGAIGGNPVRVEKTLGGNTVRHF